MNKTLLTLLTLAAASLCTEAAERAVDFRTDASAALSSMGTTKTEIYDVAVHLSDPSLAGKSVTGLRVPLEAPSVTGCQGWLSTELRLKKAGSKNINDPDVAAVAATVTDGVLTAVFPEPVVIPEGGLYAGYTFEVTEVKKSSQKNPVAVYGCYNPEGFYLHTSRKYIEWTAWASDPAQCSAIEVMIDGLPARAAATGIDVYHNLPAKGGAVRAYITNHGDAPLSDVEYTYELNGMHGSGSLHFDPALPALYYGQAPVDIPVESIGALGIYPGSLTVTAVDGASNDDLEPQRAFEAQIIPFLPVNRPLMEEYTGTWCGWCPRGMACLERMTAEHGADFVAVSYHCDDPMECAIPIPSTMGYPASRLNRRSTQDPAYTELQPRWEKMRSAFPIAEVVPEAMWTDPKQTAITCTSTTRFIQPQTEADYRVAYILVHDGMHGEGDRWAQDNSYCGQQEWNTDEYMAAYVNTDADELYDAVYNDVAIYSPDVDGTEGSIPTQFAQGEELRHTLQINAADVVGTQGGKSLIQDPGKLRLVAALIDGKTGYVVNSAWCPVAQYTGVATIESEASEAAVYYDLAGRRVARPEHGVYIKTQGGTATKIIK